MSRILVIDDDVAMRSLLRRTLERAGHRVMEASNGREALRLAAAESFDAIITDLLMPETDGIEVVLHLRKAHSTVPILAISGGGRVAGTEYLEMAKTLGANAAIAKPFEPDHLITLVEGLIQARA